MVPRKYHQEARRLLRTPASEASEILPLETDRKRHISFKDLLLKLELSRRLPPKKQAKLTAPVRRGNEMWQEASRKIKRPARELDEHYEIMGKYTESGIKGTHFMNIRGHSPEKISKVMRIPVNEVIRIIFNRYTQDHFFENNRKILIKKYGNKGDTAEIRMNNALLRAIAGKIKINNNPKYHVKGEVWKRPVI